MLLTEIRELDGGSTITAACDSTTGEDEPENKGAKDVFGREIKTRVIALVVV